MQRLIVQNEVIIRPIDPDTMLLPVRRVFCALVDSSQPMMLISTMAMYRIEIE